MTKAAPQPSSAPKIHKGSVLSEIGPSYKRRPNRTLPDPPCQQKKLAVPDMRLPDGADLNKPGGVKRILESIKVQFQTADKRHYDTINRNVMSSFQVAHFILDNNTQAKAYLGDRYKKYILKQKSDPSHILQVVFKIVLDDSKRASLYYRATRNIFLSGAHASNIPSLVKKAGGYEKLARQNARFPRAKPTEPQQEQYEVAEATNRPTTLASTPALKQNPRSSLEDKPEPNATMKCILKGNGQNLERIANGTFVGIGLRLVNKPGSARIAVIYNVIPID